MNVYITTYCGKEEKAFSSIKKAQEHRDYRIATTISMIPSNWSYQVWHYAYDETRLEVTKQDGSLVNFIYKIKKLRVQ